MKNLENSILEKIKKENIRPKKRMYFLLRNFAWMSMSAVLLFVSSLFSALLLFALVNQRLVETRVFWVFVLITLLFVGAGVIVSVFFFKRVKNNYRKNYTKIFTLFLPLLFVLMTFSIHARISQKLDEKISRIHPEASIGEHIKKRWSDNKNGRLAGSIIDVDSTGIIFFKDIRGRDHIVDPINIQRSRIDMIFDSERIIFFGEFKDEIFYAQDFVPWSVYLERVLGKRKRQ